MKMTDRWATDEKVNFVEAVEPVDEVRTWGQARKHLLSIGITERQIENRPDLPKRWVADFLASKKGFTYPNYRPR